MTTASTRRVLLFAAVIVFGVSASIDWTQEGGVTLSVDSAQARVGRPLTPVSAAGVARRANRRAVGGAAVVAPVAPVVRPACGPERACY